MERKLNILESAAAKVAHNEQQGFGVLSQHGANALRYELHPVFCCYLGVSAGWDVNTADDQSGECTGCTNYAVDFDIITPLVVDIDADPTTPSPPLFAQMSV